MKITYSCGRFLPEIQNIFHGVNLSKFSKMVDWGWDDKWPTAWRTFWSLTRSQRRPHDHKSKRSLTSSPGKALILVAIAFSQSPTRSYGDALAAPPRKSCNNLQIAQPVQHQHHSPTMPHPNNPRHWTPQPAHLRDTEEFPRATIRGGGEECLAHSVGRGGVIGSGVAGASSDSGTHRGDDAILPGGVGEHLLHHGGHSCALLSCYPARHLQLPPLAVVQSEYSRDLFPVHARLRLLPWHAPACAFHQFPSLAPERRQGALGVSEWVSCRSSCSFISLYI